MNKYVLPATDIIIKVSLSHVEYSVVFLVPERNHQLYIIVGIPCLKNFDKEDLENPESNDLIFNGDMDLWKEYANTLKLKLYLRQSEARPEVTRAGIEELFSEDVSFLSEDAYFVYFQDQSGSRNPLYATEIVAYGNNPNLVLSNTLYSYLDSIGDFNRLNYMFYLPEDGDQHKALAQGNYNDPDEPAGTNSSSYSKPIILPTTPVYLMSFTESCLLQAEAMIRYNQGSYSEAKGKYDDGVTSAYLRVLALSDIPVAQQIEQIEEFLDGKYKFPTEGSPMEIFIENIINPGNFHRMDASQALIIFR